MKITVLGCGAAFPRPGSACSGFLVEGAGARVLLDAGNGTFSRLTQHVSYRDLDALVISHSHADHIADITPLMYALGFNEDCPGALPVYAPPDVAPLIAHPLGLGSIDFFNVVFDFRPVAPVIEVGGLRFESFRTVHPVETYGFRITEGDGTFVYTADTADFPELAEDCRDAEVLLCEATFVRPNEGPPGIHMWAHESGRLAAKADAKRLVLTHVWATNPLEDAVAAASSAFDGPVEAAVEEAVYSVP